MTSRATVPPALTHWQPWDDTPTSGPRGHKTILARCGQRVPVELMSETPTCGSCKALQEDFDKSGLF